MLDDQQIRHLILRSAMREADAFQTLYELTSPVLMSVAWKVTLRKELAEEVLHDAYVKIWNDASRFDASATRPVAWMATIVRNRAIDVVSRADVSRVAQVEDVDVILDRDFDWHGSAESHEEGRQMHSWLQHCLSELKGSERQALVLSYLHGLSHGELASHLAAPLGTIKSWVRRGMRSLKSCVESCSGVQS